MKKLLCSLLLFFLVLQLHAQWTQIQDTSIMTNSVNDITQVGTTLYAATSSGVYYSNTDSIVWKRTSDFYMPVQAICAIDSDIFILVETSPVAEIFRSSDKGKTWKSLSPGPYVKTGILHLYAFNHTLFLTSGYDAMYSLDKGKTWTYTSMVYGDITPYSVTNHYVLFRRADGTDNSYYISTDGLHLNTFTKVKYKTQRISQTLYDSGKVYLIQDSLIKVYDTLSRLVTRYGSSPGLEATQDVDTQYFVNLFLKCGNTFYIAYVEDTIRNNLSGFYRNIVYSSTDGCRHWKEEKNFPLYAFNGFNFTLGDAAIGGYGNYLFHARDNSVSTINNSIQSATVLSSLADSAVLYYKGNRLKGISAHEVWTKDSALQAIIAFFLWRRYPLDQENDSVRHNRLISNNSLSEDYGNTWTPLLLPSVNGMKMQLLGYTAKDLLVYNRDSVYYSADAGRNWHAVSVGSGYTGFVNAVAAKDKNRFAIIATDTTRDTFYQAFVSDDGMKSLYPCGFPLHSKLGYTLQNLFFGGDGSLVAVFMQAAPKIEYGIYRLDRGANEWHECLKYGLPASAYNPILLITKDKFLFHTIGDGLYISNDLGDTFVKDNTFPSTLNLQYYTFDRITPHLGATLYINTNAGIWYNTTILAPTAVTKAEDKQFAGLNLYPNPARDNLYLTFSSDTAGLGSATITDMHGRICQSNSVNIIKGNNTINVSTTALRNGMYILQLKTEKQVYARKIVVE